MAKLLQELGDHLENPSMLRKILFAIVKNSESFYCQWS